MKPLIFIFLALFFSISTPYSQNMISNPGFEEGNYDPFNLTEYENFENNISAWEGRYTNINGSAWHSPDWYEGYYYPNTPCFAGSHSIGIYDYELLAQEIGDLDQYSHYLISLYIYLPPGIDENELTLDFYVSKCEPHFKDENGTDDICSYSYKHFQNWSGIFCPFNNIINIKSIDLYGYPANQWLELKFVFNTDGANYWDNMDWFGLMTKSYIPDDCALKYCYIDNVSMEEVDYCSLDTCNRLDGDIIPITHNDFMIPQAPFYIDNLDNVYSATNIELYGLLGFVRSYPDIYCVNGIHFPFYFDGENGNGYPVNAGNYYFEMDLTNDCGTVENEFHFVVISPGTAIIPPTPIVNNSAVTPLPCCSESPDIFIDNEIIYGEGEVEYIATDNIIVAASGPVLIEDDVNDLLFQAGSSIQLHPGFSSQPGTRYLATITSCTPQANFLSFPNTSQDDTDSTQNQTDTTLTNNNSQKDAKYQDDIHFQEIIIYPNPCHGRFTVLADNSKNLNVVSIFDNSGNFLVPLQFAKENLILVDISKLAKGIYYVMIDNGDCSKVEKLIYE